MKISVLIAGRGPLESLREAASAWALEAGGLGLGVEVAAAVAGPPGGGPSAALARMATRSTGEVLVLADAPWRPLPGAVARLVDGVMGRGGKDILVPLRDRDEPNPPVGRLVGLDGEEIRPLRLGDLRPAVGFAGDQLFELPAPETGCMALSRKLYWKLWGLDPDLEPISARVDLALKAWLMGHGACLDPSAGVALVGDEAGPGRETLPPGDRARIARKCLGDFAWEGWLRSAPRELPPRSELVERERRYLQVARPRNEAWFAEHFGLGWPAANPPSENVAELVRTIEGPGSIGIEGAWQEVPDVVEAYRRVASKYVASPPPYPDGRFEGRGVVICGGGKKYLPSAWVAIRMLRHLGCELPIQLWHLGPGEVDPRIASVVRSLGVETVDAEEVRREHPCRILNGWELKCYAILHSPFREVLLLDADNHPVVAPTYLFDAPEYRKAGAIFWPDYNRLEPSRMAWEAFDVPYRDEPEFETGQVVVDKRACWSALQLTMHFNEHSDYYYHHVWGDKETFHLAFRRVGTPYAMPDRGIDSLDGCMCQHDFEGRRVFQHRNMDKWKIDGSNRSIFGFLDEDLCRRFVAELRALWAGESSHDPDPDDSVVEVIRQLTGRRFVYRLVGFEERELGFEPGGFIGCGGAASERLWSVDRVGGRVVLSILGEDGVTCHLERDAGVWKGRWLWHERIPVELVEAS